MSAGRIRLTWVWASSFLAYVSVGPYDRTVLGLRSSERSQRSAHWSKRMFSCGSKSPSSTDTATFRSARSACLRFRPTPILSARFAVRTTT
jgi:hypothetical protein